MTTTWALTTATSGGGALRHSDLTLSGGDLVIANPGANYTVNAKLQNAPSGKVYLEFVLTTYSDSSVGVASSTHDVGTFLSAWSGSCGYNPSGGTVGYGAGDDAAPTGSTGAVVSLAVDVTAGRMWVRVNGGAWHNSGDPAAGTGGTSYSANFTAAHIVAQIRPGDTLTLRAARTSWTYAAPAGFSEINAPTAPTLNSSDVAGGTPTFSNGNRTIASSIDGTSMVSRSTAGSSGKFYFEGLTDGGSNNSWGVTNGSQTLTTSGDAEPNKGINIYSNGSAWFWYSDNVPEYGQLSTGNGVAGDRIGVAVDPVNGRIWARLNNGNWNNSGTANPVTNTGGVNIADFGSTLYGTAWSGYSYIPTTVYFAQSDWAYSAPVGFDQLSASAAVADDMGECCDPNADVVARMHLDARRWAYQYGYLSQANQNTISSTEVPLAVGEPGEADIYQVLQHFVHARHPSFEPVQAWDETDAIADANVSADQTLDIVTQTANVTTSGALSVSANQTLDILTATETATVTVAASATQNLALPTQTANVGVRASVSATQTLDILTATETATVIVAASATQNLVLLSQTANVTTGNTASASANQTLALPTQTANATVRVAASATQTLLIPTQTANAVARVSLSATQSLALPTQTATVTVVDPRNVSAAQTLALPTQTANAVVVPLSLASANQTLLLPTQAANAVARIAVSVSQTMPDLSQTATVTGPTWQAVAGPGGSWSTSGSASGIWIQQPDPSGTWS